MAHIMLDLETLGRGHNAVLMSIGAVRFTETEILDKFYVAIDVESAQSIGLTMDAGTVLWWLDPLRAEARERWLMEDKHHIADAMSGFVQWVKEDTELAGVWGNGAIFDNVKVQSACAALGLGEPWPFWADRCYRTEKNLRPDIKLERVGTYHHALDDAESQARHLQAIWAALGVEKHG